MLPGNNLDTCCLGFQKLLLLFSWENFFLDWGGTGRYSSLCVYLRISLWSLKQTLLLFRGFRLLESKTGITIKFLWFSVLVHTSPGAIQYKISHQLEGKERKWEHVGREKINISKYVSPMCAASHAFLWQCHQVTLWKSGNLSKPQFPFLKQH